MALARCDLLPRRAQLTTPAGDVTTDDPTSRLPGRGLADILRRAARLGLELQPEAMPARAPLLHEATYDSLISCPKIIEPCRRRVALDTAITLCP